MKNNKIPENANIYADSANPDKIVMIQNAGFGKCVGAKKDILAGIDFMKSKKIHITKCSINIIKEIESYRWKLNKNSEAMEQPIKLLDDILDGCRYSIFRGEAINISITHITGKKRKNDFDNYDAKEIHHSINIRDNMLGY